MLTHGHFDHIGAVHTLAHEWDVPVYAHALELPYLTGQSSYPPPDPLVGGGVLSVMSALYPRRPIDLGRHAKELPQQSDSVFRLSLIIIYVVCGPCQEVLQGEESRRGPPDRLFSGSSEDRGARRRKSATRFGARPLLTYGCK